MVHEWALAESIILYLQNKGIRKTRRLVIKIGLLQNIDLDILKYALREIAGLNNIDIGEVDLEVVEPVFKCNNCGYTWRINPGDIDNDVREAIHFLPEAIYAYYKCPRCRSIDFEITRGRGLEGVEVEE